MSASVLLSATELSPVEEAYQILDSAIEQYAPFGLYSCFSGGDDSLATAILTSQHPAFAGCVHVNTGIGVELTRQFVRETCREQGWPLFELHATPGEYRRIVLKDGFPGPAAHKFVYARLKERPLRKFLAEQKQGRSRLARMGLVTGVRKQESVRRMGVVRPVQKDKERSFVWVAPLIHWSREQVREFIAAAGLQRNPVSPLLGMSGECLCGAFAQPGELQRLDEHFPEVSNRIARLEAEALVRGVHAVWDEPPAEAEPVVAPFDPEEFCLSLCSGCELRGKRRKRGAGVSC